MENGITQIGKVFMVLGGLIFAIGGLLLFFGKVQFLGKLPGDILIQKKNFTLYFPIATSILISILLTLIFWLGGKK